MSNQEPAPQVAQTQPPVKPQGKKPAPPPRARRNWDVEKRVFLLFAALSGFWWVALGAMAGHGLFSEGLHAEYFDKAHRYQIVHTLALLVLIALPQRLSPLLCRSAGFLWLLGLFAFCGSLYAMAFVPTLDVRPIVPVGGIAFLLGWTMLFFAACFGDSHAR